MTTSNRTSIHYEDTSPRKGEGMTDTKHHPILFSGPMVRAILDGSKTQTRRVLKPQIGEIDKPFKTIFGEWMVTASDGSHISEMGGVKYKKREHLWVREAWCGCKQMDAIKSSEFSKGEPIGYLADGAIRSRGCMMIAQGKTRPSIFMPRWASRITLEVTDVRVERLNDISEQDAIAEGIYETNPPLQIGLITWKDYLDGGNITCPSHSFATLWDSINAKTCPWESNPWIVAYTFKVVSQ